MNPMYLLPSFNNYQFMANLVYTVTYFPISRILKKQISDIITLSNVHLSLSAGLTQWFGAVLMGPSLTLVLLVSC